MEASIHTIASNNLLIIFAIVSITGIICSKLSEIIKVPDVVLYLLVGILIGPSFLKFIDIRGFQCWRWGESISGYLIVLLVFVNVDI